MYVIIGNYGNESIAVLQWVIEQKITNAYFVTVDTGWAADRWCERIAQGVDYANRHNVIPIQLKSVATFAELVEDRKEFPNQKFQWCPGILKGLPINDWLDTVDPACEATLLFGKRRSATRASQHLTKQIAASEYYNDRALFYPLIDHTEAERDALIERAGFSILLHRSLECDPCIHSSKEDLKRMDSRALEKTFALEQSVGKVMFPSNQSKQINDIKTAVEMARNSGKSEQKNYNELFDMGCGSPFGCGE